jgi:hypothetical protein
MDALGKDWTEDPMGAAKRLANVDPESAIGLFKLLKGIEGDDKTRELTGRKIDETISNNDALARNRQEVLEERKRNNEERISLQRELAEMRAQLEKMKESGRNSRDNPPPRVSAVERIRDKVESQGYDSLTAGQKKVYDDSLPSKKASRIPTGPAKKAGIGWGKAEVDN